METIQDSFVLSWLSFQFFSVVLNTFDTEQLQIGNWVERRQTSAKLDRDKTKLSCLVANCVNTANVDVLSTLAVLTS